MTVPFNALSVTVTRDITDAMRLATREAVNVSALEVTTDARNRVRRVLGPEQRMSRLTTRQRNGKASHVSADTIAKGGTRINPYYRQADSVTKPVALVGARGPAHLIEHSRRGGYDVRPRRKAVTDVDTAESVAALEATVFGRTATETTKRAAQLRHAGALGTPGGFGFYGKVKPGPILRPRGGPIMAAFHVATTTINRAAGKAWEDTMARQLSTIGGSGPLGKAVGTVRRSI